MKKLLLIAIIAISLSADGLWGTVKNSSSISTLNSKQYAISSIGARIKGYVINVPEMKSICFIIYSSHGIPMVCKTYKEIGK